jgi:uncharacterized protein YbaA (DUF1428 family)
MTYIDGFVAAVPTANKQKFIEHAKKGDSVFVELGATKVLECWGDDVPEGSVTDFRRAVKAKDDETVVFSWVEWPDKATRDKAMPKMMEDPRMQPDQNPMPFDGKRLIYGGFSPVVELN